MVYIVWKGLFFYISPRNCLTSLGIQRAKLFAKDFLDGNMNLLTLILGLIFTTVKAFFKLPFSHDRLEDKRNVFHYEFEGKMIFLFQHFDQG